MATAADTSTEPNGASFDHDYTFKAPARIMTSDGREELGEATCYVKGDKKPQPSMKGTKPPPTAAQKREFVCEVAIGTTVAVGCYDVEMICGAGGAVVFPAFCGGVGLACIITGIVFEAGGHAYFCREPEETTPPPPADPPASKMLWDITPGSDEAPHYSPNLPAGGTTDVFPAGESVWDWLPRELLNSLYAGSAQSAQSANNNGDSVGVGVPPDDGAITNGISGLPPGDPDVPTPDPNDDPGAPPDTGGGG